MSTSPANPFHHLDMSLQIQIKTITEQIQKEIKRLNEHPIESTGNSNLYLLLEKQLNKIKEEISHHDYLIALGNAVDHLKKAAILTTQHAKNQELLPNLQAVNANLCACKNIRR